MGLWSDLGNWLHRHQPAPGNTLRDVVGDVMLEDALCNEVSIYRPAWTRRTAGGHFFQSYKRHGRYLGNNSNSWGAAC